MIELKGINKTYKSKKANDTVALKDINISFPNKGLVFIVGKSGSGKSTLLNLLGSLDIPDSGEILVDNTNIVKFNSRKSEEYRNTYVSFVFQEFNLLEEFNVYENINISLKLNKIEDNNKIKNILSSLDLEGLEGRNINELSGGQKQRVSIARAIIKNPKLILADEPTGNLDSNSSKQVFDILKKISKDHLVIVVSHDIESSMKYADRIIRIEDGVITSDSNNEKIKSDNNIKLHSSKLPFNYMLKMAYSYIMAKPIRLILTILLTMISLSFMSFAINVYNFKEDSLLINTMKDNNEYTLRIEHKNVEIEKNSRKEEALSFSTSDIEYIENITKSKANREYSIYENGDILRFAFGYNEEYKDNEAGQKSRYHKEALCRGQKQKSRNKQHHKLSEHRYRRDPDCRKEKPAVELVGVRVLVRRAPAVDISKCHSDHYRSDDYRPDYLR